MRDCFAEFTPSCIEGLAMVEGVGMRDERINHCEGVERPT